MNLTEALAHSNNAYFEAVGRKLGFEKVAYYAHQYGLGELAGYDIPGEQLGTYPDEVIPEKLGGVGKMCSFGEGISMTPLQLGAMVSAIANGGTLYYLQHPTTPEEITNFQPRIKRQLDIAPAIPEISVGMAGAVQYGTARRLGLNFNEEEILGKTGTCSHAGTRFGWFASYANTSSGRVVVVVFPARRAADVWSQGSGDCRPHVPQSLRSQLLSGRSVAACGYGCGALKDGAAKSSQAV
jgi:penicillin-binding protein 2